MYNMMYRQIDLQTKRNVFVVLVGLSRSGTGVDCVGTSSLLRPTRKYYKYVQRYSTYVRPFPIGSRSHEDY